MTDLLTMWSSLLTQLDAQRPDTLQARRTAAHRNGRARPATATPVAILSGFLGSGKSTLLADLLVNPPQGMVVRALVNDVGSLRFDPTLVAGSSRVEVELTNGCGCCERTGELAAALDRLAEADAGGGADLIVVEASGVADPFALGQIVEAGPDLRLDRIVTTVDAMAIDAQLEHGALGPVVRRQIEAAHHLVLTKADQLGGAAIDDAVAALAQRAPGRVVSASRRDELASSALCPQSLRGARPNPRFVAADHDFVTITLTQRPGSAIDRSRLEAAIGAGNKGLLRTKGRLLLDDGYAAVQSTPTGHSVMATASGACGLTVVAVTGDDLAPLAALLM